jgi:molecular chaperone GrpE
MSKKVLKNREVEKLKKRLKKMEGLRDQYLKEWQRARADLINYKREEMSRVSELIDHRLETLILEMLSILDTLEIGEKSLPNELKENEYVQGILQIKKQLIDFLKGLGVEELEIKGKEFDPRFSEAVERVKKKGIEPDKIVEVIKKGYTFKGRLIRPSKVKVSK